MLKSGHQVIILLLMYIIFLRGEKKKTKRIAVSDLTVIKLFSFVN